MNLPQLAIGRGKKRYGASYNEFCRRKDKNHNDIEKALRLHGFSVFDTHALRKFVDIVAGKFGFTFMIEVKGEGKKLTKGTQSDFHDDWQGHICVIRTVEDVKALVQHAKRISEIINHANLGQ